jgi:hypothetical protein
MYTCGRAVRATIASASSSAVIAPASSPVSNARAARVGVVIDPLVVVIGVKCVGLIAEQTFQCLEIAVPRAEATFWDADEKSDSHQATR